jgi:hypothetical protein
MIMQIHDQRTRAAGSALVGVGIPRYTSLRRRYYVRISSGPENSCLFAKFSSRMAWGNAVHQAIIQLVLCRHIQIYRLDVGHP